MRFFYHKSFFCGTKVPLFRLILSPWFFFFTCSFFYTISSSFMKKSLHSHIRKRNPVWDLTAHAIFILRADVKLNKSDEVLPTKTKEKTDSVKMQKKESFLEIFLWNPSIREVTFREMNALRIKYSSNPFIFI